MGKLVGGGVLLVIAFSLLLAAATVRAQRPGPVSNLLRFAGYGVGVLASGCVTPSATWTRDRCSPASASSRPGQ